MSKAWFVVVYLYVAGLLAWAGLCAYATTDGIVIDEVTGALGLMVAGGYVALTISLLRDEGFRRTRKGARR